MPQESWGSRAEDAGRPFLALAGLPDTVRAPLGLAVGTGLRSLLDCPQASFGSSSCLFSASFFSAFLCLLWALELCAMSFRLGGRPVLTQGVSWAARLFLLLEVFEMCLIEEVASSRTVWSTQTRFRMCGNPCGAELGSTEQLPCHSLSSELEPQGAQRPVPASTLTPGVSQHTSHIALFPFPVQVARWEKKTQKLSGAFGSPYLACYALGGAILFLNVLRSHW